MSLNMPGSLKAPQARWKKGSHKASIVWLSRDLRVQGHEPFLAHNLELHTDLATMIPVFCLSPEMFQPRRLSTHGGIGVPKLGPHRLRFLLQCLHSLSRSLAQLGSRLLCRLGRPRDIIAALVEDMVTIQSSLSHVELHHYCDTPLSELGTEEEVHEAFRSTAERLGLSCSCHVYWGLTLTAPEKVTSAFGSSSVVDCTECTPPQNFTHPSRYENLPGTMTAFHKWVLGNSEGHAALPTPTALPPMPEGWDALMQSGNSALAKTSVALPETAPEVYRAAGADQALQNLWQLVSGQEASPAARLDGTNAAETPYPFGLENDPRTAFSYYGSEEAAHERLASAVSAEALTEYKDLRSHARGEFCGARLSPYLSLGVLSPLQVAAKLAETKAQHPELAEQCDWMMMHLHIRDYFIFSTLKLGKQVLSDGGMDADERVQWELDLQKFSRWASGSTGFPFVDACMKELAATGWMSNRGRQNVASLLTKALGQDWRAGADLFESLLVDGDPAVNAANWSYIAGVGADPRDRVFKTVTQGMRYDALGEHVATWIPQLATLASASRHAPWSLSIEEATTTGFKPGEDYPHPILDPKTQIGAGPKRRTA